MTDVAHGTVSHGTMRAEDLIPAFLDALAEHDMAAHDAIRDEYGHSWEDDWDYDSEDAEFMLEALFDALNNIAPEGTYFGSHPGDGCDYGFWAAEAF